MVRAAAKNHANVAVVTSPARYDEVLAALDTRRRARRQASPRARARGVRAYRRVRRPDRLGAAGPDGSRRPARRTRRPVPATLTIGLEKVETLRYGENPHQPAARYRRPGRRSRTVRSASRAAPLQGKALSYNNVLDAAAASALGRALRGPGVVIVKHTNPCGAAERATLADAWDAALEADPVSAFGGVVALTRPVDRATAERLVSIFLEIVVAPAFDDGRPRGPRDEAQPARSARRGARRRRCPGRAARPDRLDPHGRRRGPRHDPRRHARRPDDLDLRDPSRADRRRTASTSTSPGGWSVA